MPSDRPRSSRRSAVAHFSGLAAEEAAAQGYLAAGGQVRDVRWRCPEGEIDLVVETPDGIVFVEVKARRGFADAAYAIRPVQWRRLAAAATRWLAEHPESAQNCRFDVVLVDRSGATERIENAASFDEA